MKADDKIALYRLLFRGRDDIFARRWEKDGKSGYSPAYVFNWDEFNAHRAQGGSLKDFENKTPLALTYDIIHQHLLGQVGRKTLVLSERKEHLKVLELYTQTNCFPRSAIQTTQASV